MFKLLAVAVAGSMTAMAALTANYTCDRETVQVRAPAVCWHQGNEAAVSGTRRFAARTYCCEPNQASHIAKDQPAKVSNKGHPDPPLLFPFDALWMPVSVGWLSTVYQ